MEHTYDTYSYQAQLDHQPEVKAFFHQPSFTWSYVVSDPATKQCAIIDSVLDFDLPSGTLSHESANAIADYVRETGLTVEWHLETHMHADHLSAATYLREQLGGKVAIGKHIAEVQDMYRDVFHVDAAELQEAQTAFDVLWEDFATFTVGSLSAFTFYAPGHTPADIVYGIGDALFVGDSLFMPDFGSARCDFPRGSAASMYDSVQKILALPEAMRMFMCHDYLPEGRTEYQYETTVGEQKANNIHLKEGTEKTDFIARREARDATLSLPIYMIPSLQVNVRAGRIPEEHDVPMLKWPVNSIFSMYPKD
jgi:glyoxylase-like metal-dependent hydrolase (beta-lactamase superfamily II)